MREYEEVSRLEKKTRLKKLVCDLCGKKGTEGWRSSKWNINETVVEVEVQQRERDNYPDCSWGTEYVIDICPECFKNRLVPWLRSEGAKIEEVKWEW